MSKAKKLIEENLAESNYSELQHTARTMSNSYQKLLYSLAADIESVDSSGGVVTKYLTSV